MFKKIAGTIFLTILIIGASLLFYAFLIEPNLLTVKHYDLKIRKWDPALNNFKIVAIADIHGGSNFIDEAKIREIVKLANAENPDLIVLLGDYVAQNHFDRSKLKMPLEIVAENLKGLKSRCGVFAILGNHDGWYDVKRIRQELENDGYRVLENEAASIEKDNAKLRIVGLPDLLSNTPENALPKVLPALERLDNKEGKIIILTHNPDDMVYVSGEPNPSPDFILLLAGHTHGGQVRLPFIGAPVVPSAYHQKYAAGFIRENDFDMFVTTGIGTSILPVRFNVPPEISVLNITAE